MCLASTRRLTVLILISSDSIELVMSKKRIKIGKRRARKDFRRGLRTEVKNIVPPPQRGGYRM